MKKEEFCRKLKQARIDANLKQSQVSVILDLPTSAISLMESGERKVDIFELFELSKIYQKDIQYFIQDTKSDGNQRWYDKDPLLSQAITLLKESPDKIRKASAMGVIGFLQELHPKNNRSIN